MVIQAAPGAAVDTVIRGVRAALERRDKVTLAAITDFLNLVLTMVMHMAAAGAQERLAQMDRRSVETPETLEGVMVESV
jgi:small basic protein|tara:strand:+ start:336 stop:572 length:237 start_codon:yes stop_codon:yes gene_type:complete